MRGSGGRISTEWRVGLGSLSTNLPPSPLLLKSLNFFKAGRRGHCNLGFSQTGHAHPERELLLDHAPSLGSRKEKRNGVGIKIELSQCN